MEQINWKSETLIYEEADRRLDIYLEVSGVPQFDLLASMSDFKSWTVPTGNPISEEERRVILDRLAHWTSERKIRLDISQPFSPEEMRADCERRKLANQQKLDRSSAHKGTLLKRILGILIGK